MKTNFISNLKQGLFLLVAVLGTFLSYAQPDQISTIGGTKIPGGTDPIGIGGRGSDVGTGQIIPIASLTGKTDCIFATLQDTGGGKGTGTSTDTGQYDDDDFDPFYIGGKNTDGGLGSFDTNDIGGRDTGGKGTSSDTGQFDDDDQDPYDIGGRGTNTGTGTGELAFSYLEYTPGYGCILDTSGRDSGGGLKTGETGGRNGTGTSTTGDYDDDDDDDTGGRGAGSTTGEVAVIAPLSVFDFQ